jgi:hypothetical protein
MEAHYDLRKFIAGTVVAQRRGVLSSGRDARGAAVCRRVTAPGSTAGAAGRCLVGVAEDRQIEIVKRLTPGVGIESLMRFGSDQTAAEALQEAETEVGVRELIDRGANAAVQAAGQLSRPANPAIDVGLTA